MYSSDGESVEACCLKYKVYKDEEIFIEVDVLPPNIRVHPAFSPFISEKILNRREEITDNKGQANDQLEKMCSQSTKTDYLSLDSKTQGLSLTDLLNTQSLLVFPLKTFNSQDFINRKPTVHDRSRSRPLSRQSMSVISLSSDEEDDDSDASKIYLSRRRFRRLARQPPKQLIC